MMEVVKKPFIGFKITNIRFRKGATASKIIYINKIMLL